jgi:hypothetical protein
LFKPRSEGADRKGVHNVSANHFPDSLEKRELRRRDGRRIGEFRCTNELTRRLSYCGMPSVEFLDVVEWREHISEVCAIEVDPAIVAEMRLSWDQLPLNVKIQFKELDILEFLKTTDDCFDLYNLDFYGGFLFTRSHKPARIPDAIKAVVRRHGERHVPCILISTFNVRDTGDGEYLRFLDELPQRLRGWKHIEESVKAHTEGHAQKMKACFPLFLLHECRKYDLQLTVAEPFVYRSSALMLHFYMEVVPRSVDLPRLAHEEDSMVNLLNLPLRQLDFGAFQN